MEDTVAADWRSCVPPEGPTYYYHLPTGTVAWSLPPHISASNVAAFSEADESAVEEEDLVSAEEAARSIQEASKGKLEGQRDDTTVSNIIISKTGTTSAVVAASDYNTDVGAQHDDNSSIPEAATSPIAAKPVLEVAESSGLPSPSDILSAITALPIDIISAITALHPAEYPALWSRLEAVMPSGNPIAPIYAALHPNLCRGQAVLACSPTSTWCLRHTASSGRGGDGEPYYANYATGEQSWARPEGYLDEQEFGEVESILARISDSAGLSDILAEVGVLGWKVPLVRAEFEALAAFSERAETGELGQGKPPSCMHLYQALMRLRTLLTDSDMTSHVLRDMWRQILIADDMQLVRTVWGVATMSAAPPAVALTCLRIIAMLAAVHPDILLHLMDTTICTFPAAIKLVFRQLRAGVYGRKMFHAVSTSLQLSMASYSTAPDTELLCEWLQFACVMVVSACHAAPSKVAVTEETISWDKSACLLVELLADMSALSSPRSPATPSTGPSAVVAEALRFLSALHRLFEVRILSDGQLGFESPGLPATSRSVRHAMDSFGVITPILIGFSYNWEAHPDKLHGVLSHISAQVVHLLTSNRLEAGLWQFVSGELDAPSMHKDKPTVIDWHRSLSVATISFLCAVFELPVTSKLLYKNDLNVLVDLILKELQDVVVLDLMRICLLRLLRAVLLYSQWATPHSRDRYRLSEICSVLSSLFDLSTSLASGLPSCVREAAEEVLISAKDVLEA